MSTSAFTTASSVFLLLELYGVFELFYRREVDTNMMLGAFKGYVELKDSNSSKRLLHFYADWVGNNKLIMCLLLLSTMISSDPLTKLLVSISMSVGTLLYFPRMNGMLFNMEKQGDMVEDNYIPLKVAGTIGGLLLPCWIAASIAEYQEYLTYRSS